MNQQREAYRTIAVKELVAERQRKCVDAIKFQLSARWYHYLMPWLWLRLFKTVRLP